MSAALCGCGQAQSGGTVRNQVMDPVTEIPEWLKVTVESALPSDSLNVWIPTGELATSSLIRVPRFPAPKHENDKQPSPFDILPVDFSAIHSITGVRNEQQSFQLSVAAVHELTGLSVRVEDLISEKGDTIRSLPTGWSSADFQVHRAPQRSYFHFQASSGSEGFCRLRPRLPPT